MRPDAAVVIGAVSLESPWLEDCLDSLAEASWPVVVNVTENWELATIEWASQYYREFVFLPESTVVKDVSFLDRCFVEYAGKSVNLGTAQGLKFRMYLGKFRSEVLNILGVPRVANKNEAIAREVDWCTAYAAIETNAHNLIDLGEPLEHTDVRERRHGRVNMVVENSLLRRYKGTWA